MFLPTQQVKEVDLVKANRHLPYIRRGQWIKIPSGAKGQYVGFNPRNEIVWICWHKGEKLNDFNLKLSTMCESFDKRMASINVA